MGIQDRVGDGITVVILTVFVINIGGFLYNSFNPSSTIKFGLTIYLLGIFLVLFFINNLVRKNSQPLTTVTKTDWAILVVMLIVVVVILVYAPKLVPSLFSTANTQLQSIVGVS